MKPMSSSSEAAAERRDKWKCLGVAALLALAFGALVLGCHKAPAPAAEPQALEPAQTYAQREAAAWPSGLPKVYANATPAWCWVPESHETVARRYACALAFYRVGCVYDADLRCCQALQEMLNTLPEDRMHLPPPAPIPPPPPPSPLHGEGPNAGGGTRSSSAWCGPLHRPKQPPRHEDDDPGPPEPRGQSNSLPPSPCFGQDPPMAVFL